MIKMINKIYEESFKSIFSLEEYYEYLIYSSRPLGGYRRDFKKYENYQLFIDDIITTKIEKYYKALISYIDKIEREIEIIKKYSIDILHIKNRKYPKRLSEIKNPPRFIFFKGDLSFYIKSIAIVGTRKFDNSASIATNYFTKKIVENNLTIVSGNAKGVDRTAQHRALDSGGRVIIITGVGLGFFLKNSEITNPNILLLTEFPLFFKGNRQSFPIRNRIIAGISLGTIMIQAPKKSGAIYTANYTLEQNKPLFVPPGELFNSKYEGNFSLLKIDNKNIYLLTDISDILKVFRITPTPEISTLELDNREEIILDVIKEFYPKAISFDKLYNQCSQMKITMFQLKLFNLLINDIIEELPGKNYIYKNY